MFKGLALTKDWTIPILLSAAIVIVGVFLMFQMAPAMPQRSSYVPYSIAEGHMSIPNALGDKDFKCQDANCSPDLSFLGTHSHLYYANRSDAIQGIPIPNSTPCARVTRVK